MSVVLRKLQREVFILSLTAELDEAPELAGVQNPVARRLRTRGRERAGHRP